MKLRWFFLREARFPDEKFWTKGGTPIVQKGKPTSSRGTSHADYGAYDKDDAPSKRQYDLYGFNAGDGTNFDPEDFERVAKSLGVDVKQSHTPRGAWVNGYPEIWYELKGPKDAIKKALDHIDHPEEEGQWL